MANKKMWDWMDKAEGRKDSSYKNMEKEKARQGVKKSIAKKMSRSIDIANEKAKKPHSIFRGRDYLGTKKGSKNYKGEYKY